MFCPNCGQKVEPKDGKVIFCPFCGGVIAASVETPPAPAPVTVAAPAPAPAPAPANEKAPKKKRKALWIALIAVVCAVAVLLGAFWMFWGDGANNNDENRDETGGQAKELLEFCASVFDIYIDAEETVLFSVKVVEENDDVTYVDLCEENSPIAKMYDDGNNGDVAAADGIYSARVTLRKAQISNVNYCAKSGSVQSNGFEICYYRDITEQEFASYTALLNKINAMTFEEAAAFVRESEEIQQYDIAHDARQITYKSVYGITGLWEEYAADTKGSALSVTTDADARPSALSVSRARATNSALENSDVVVLRPFRSSEFVYDDFIETGAAIEDALGGTMTVYDDAQVSLSVMKSLDDYGIVLIDSHGGRTLFAGKTFIVTGESFDETRFLWDPVYYLCHLEYSADYLSGRIFGTSKNRAAVSSKFFDKYYEKDSLDGSFWFLGTCHSFGNDSLPNALRNKGADAVVGFTNVVSVGYCNDVLRGIVDESLLSFSYNMSEAMKYTRNRYGEYDPRNPKTKLEFAGDGNYRLISIVGSIRGKVADAVSKTPLADTSISVRSAGSKNEIKKVKTDSDGNFIVDLDEGTYDMVVSANGYMDCKIANVVVEKGQTTYLENTILLTKIEGNPTAYVSGLVSNAVTGAGVSGAAIRFRSGWGNTNGDYVSNVQIYTDSSGGFRTDLLPYGYYTMEIVLEGYTTQYVNVVAATNEDASYNPNITLVPEAHGSDFRITLEWEENPRDEDAHIVGEGFHVYYRQKNAYDSDGNLIANLDHDDTRGNGFETITLTVDPNQIYQYYVYHYAGTGSLSTSNAIVKVYQGGVMIKQYNVPVDQGTGRYWNVFNIIDGKVVSINRISDSSEQ